MILSFNDCFLAAKIIADKVKCASGSYIGVYGIPLGGMIPAAMVAYHLRLPVVTNAYNGVLVVDDTIVTGKTMRWNKHYDTAVIACHGRDAEKCKYYGLIINAPVTFEWETKTVKV